jgi:hypothetical protein
MRPLNLSILVLLGASAITATAAAAPPAAPPPDAAEKKPVSEAPSRGSEAASLPVAQELSFKGGAGLELWGTLVMPPGQAPAPAVLLLPGSGPTDRDGNQPPSIRTDVLKQIAERLASEGVASLRFDKRACAGYSALWPSDPQALGAFFGYQPQIEDIKGALRALQAQPRIDPARCALLGHSEGGFFALQVASDLAADALRPAALCCIATPGRTLDHLLREQIAMSLTAPRRVPQATVDAVMSSLERGINGVKESRSIPADLPAGLRPLFNPTTVDLLYAWFTVEPLELARAVRGPVLVLNGDSDIQVSAERDAKALATALAARQPSQPVTLVVVEAMSHNLKETTGTADLGMSGPVKEEALRAISAWVRTWAEPASSVSAK